MLRGGAQVLYGVGCATAVADWLAVHRGDRRLEYVLKPATMLAVTAAAARLDPVDNAQRWWFVAAFAWSLLGDVLLMLPERDETFVAGLASFLIGHVAFVVGFAVRGADLYGRWWVVVLVIGLWATAGQRILCGARAHDRRLLTPVAAYITVISAMAAFAIAVGGGWAIAGGCLFVCSDALLGWNRFVREQRHGRLAVMITYHLAQLALVLALIN